MNKRYLSLDTLRGITIFGMVFCAIIPNGVLPAWMYHIQNPPPTHELNMTISGLSWVDLVFPVFIFCMGAAIPFSGRNKIAKGIRTSEYLKEIFERFIMLWLFSYLYVFMFYSDIQTLMPQILTLCGFAALFPLYIVINKSWHTLERFANNPLPLRAVGVLLCCIIICIGHFYLGEEINVQRRGIIIFLLAFLYLFGSIIWYFTRDKLWLRAVIFFAVLTFTIITQHLNLPAITYANPDIRWWFNFEYIYFLLLLIPATYIGDLLKHSTYKIEWYSLVRGDSWWIFLFMAGIIFWELYAVYMRIIVTNIIITPLLLIITGYGLLKLLPQYKNMFLTAAVFIMAGVIMDPIDGGLKKVPCTISYCFLTFGLSTLMLFICDYICKYFHSSLFVNTFQGAGKNPLMSYIAHGSLIVPIMNITGLQTLYVMAAPPAYPLLGIFRAAIIVFITMWIVSLFSKKGIFWRA